jgi:hypothetical protein
MAVSVRTELHGGGRLEELRALLGLPRPVTAAALLDSWAQPVVLEEPLVTVDGVALGGHHKVTLLPDGRWHYEGHFRATGWPSYKASVAARVTGSDGTVLVFAASGEVFGTNEPGDREDPWDQTGTNPLIRYQWAGLKHAQLTHDLQHDADFFGSAGDVLAFITKAAVAVVLGGVGGLVVICAFELIDLLELQELALPGTVGLIVTGGVLLVFGPGAIIPALIAGVAAGAITAALVKQRRLTDAEWSLVETVFPGQLPRERIVITNLTGAGGRPFTMPGPGDAIIVNLGGGYDDPANYTGKGQDDDRSRKPGQLLIHELTHAWQIAHSEFIPGLVCNGIANQVGTLGGNMDVYKYGPAGQNWDQFNLEQQGSIVDDWYAGTGQQQTYGPMRQDDANPYWHYLRDHIRAGVA